MPKKNIVVSLTDSDKDIISWLNLLNTHHQSPFMWIDAMLIAEKKGQELFAGDVLVAEPARRKKINGFDLEMFGGSFSSSEKQKPSRTIRGINNEYIPGSQLVHQTKRPIVIDYVEELKRRGMKLSPYLKNMIRSNIHIIYNVEPPAPDDSKMKEILKNYDLFQRSQDLSRDQTTRVKQPKLQPPPKTHSVNHQEKSQVIELPHQEASAPKPKPKRNPLLDYIS